MSLMKHAYIFPGQGSQFAGMGKELYGMTERSKKLFEDANEILGFRISDIMFSGTEEELKETHITQPAIFIHSVASFMTLPVHQPDMVAGHSLGEFSALVANSTLLFEDGLKLVSARGKAMQHACELNPSSMAAVLGLEDNKVEDICGQIEKEFSETVVPANYNSPGQLVISGTIKGVELACERLKAAGAKRALVLPVRGAFHSPLMMPAKEELESAINSTTFGHPVCPVYQNITASAESDPEKIKLNLISQLTGPVRWKQSVETMIEDGAYAFTECGPGKVLQGLVQKINKAMTVHGIN